MIPIISVYTFEFFNIFKMSAFKYILFLKCLQAEFILIV